MNGGTGPGPPKPGGAVLIVLLLLMSLMAMLVLDGAVKYAVGGVCIVGALVCVAAMGRGSTGTPGPGSASVE